MKFKYLIIKLLPVVIFAFFNANTLQSQTIFQSDKIPAKGGDIEITFIGHGSLMLKFQSTVIQIDPFSKLANYNGFPKANLLLLTHHHGDHLDTVAIQNSITVDTKLLMTEKCKELLPNSQNVVVLKNSESYKIGEIEILAIPAYNLVNKRENGDVFHPKGEGNGYIITLGGKKVYIAGDTENTPEMKSLKKIDIAFLPMNLPYTMTPEMVADAAKAFRPKILYPYHTGQTNINLLSDLLKNEKGIELRIREMK